LDITINEAEFNENEFINNDFISDKSNLNESINFFLDNSMFSGIITGRSKEESINNILYNLENFKVSIIKNQIKSSNKFENFKNHYKNYTQKALKYEVNHKNIYHQIYSNNPKKNTIIKLKDIISKISNKNDILSLAINCNVNKKNKNSKDRKNKDQQKIKNQIIIDKNNPLIKSYEELYSRNKNRNHIIDKRNTDLNIKDKNFLNDVNMINNNNNIKYNFKTQNHATPNILIKDTFDNNKNLNNEKIIDLKGNNHSDKNHNKKTRSLQNLQINNKALLNLNINKKLDKILLDGVEENKNIIKINQNLLRKNKENKNQLYNKKNTTYGLSHKNIEKLNNQIKESCDKNSKNSESKGKNNKTKENINDIKYFLKNKNFTSNKNEDVNFYFSKDKYQDNNILIEKQSISSNNLIINKEIENKDDIFFNRSDNKSNLNLNSISEETIETKILNDENYEISDYIDYKSEVKTENNFVESNEFLIYDLKKNRYVNIDSKINNHYNYIGILKSNKTNFQCNNFLKNKIYDLPNQNSIKNINSEISSLAKKNFRNSIGEELINNKTSKEKDNLKIKQNEGINIKNQINSEENNFYYRKDNYNHNNNDVLNLNEFNKDHLMSNLKLNLNLNEKKTRNKNFNCNLINSKDNNNLNSNTSKSINKPIKSITYSENSPFKLLQKIHYKTIEDLKNNNHSNKNKKSNIITIKNNNNSLNKNKTFIQNNKNAVNIDLKITNNSPDLNINHFTNCNNPHQINPNILNFIKNSSEFKTTTYSKSNSNLLLKDYIINKNLSKEKIKTHSSSSIIIDQPNTKNNKFSKNIKQNKIEKDYSYHNLQSNKIIEEKKISNQKINDIERLFNKNLFYKGKNSLSYNHLNPLEKFNNVSNVDNLISNKNNIKIKKDSFDILKKNRNIKSQQIINLNVNLNFNNLNLNLQRTKSNKSGSEKTDDKMLFNYQKNNNNISKKKNNKNDKKKYEIKVHNSSSNTNYQILGESSNNKDEKKVNKNNVHENIHILSNLLKISIPDKNSRNKQSVSKIISSSSTKLTNLSQNNNLKNFRTNQANYNLTNKTKSQLNLNHNCQISNEIYDNSELFTICPNLKINFKNLNLNSNISNHIPISLTKNPEKDFTENHIENDIIVDRIQDEKMFSFKKIDIGNQQNNEKNLKKEKDLKNLNNFIDPERKKRIKNKNYSLKDIIFPKDSSYGILSVGKKQIELSDKICNNKSNNHTYHDRKNSNPNIEDNYWEENMIYENNNNKDVVKYIISELNSNIFEENDYKSDSKLELIKKKKELYNISMNEINQSSESQEKIVIKTDIKILNKNFRMLNKNINTNDVLKKLSDKNLIYHNSYKELDLLNKHNNSIKSFKNSSKNLSPNYILNRNIEKTNSKNKELEKKIDDNHKINNNKKTISSPYSKSLNNLGLLNNLINNPLILMNKNKKDYHDNNSNNNIIVEKNSIISENKNSIEKIINISQDNIKKKIFIEYTNKKSSNKIDKKVLFSTKYGTNPKNSISRNKIVKIHEVNDINNFNNDNKPVYPNNKIFTTNYKNNRSKNVFNNNDEYTKKIYMNAKKTQN